MDAQTRIAHVLRKYDPQAWGGTETHVAALTGALPEPPLMSPRSISRVGGSASSSAGGKNAS